MTAERVLVIDTGVFLDLDFSKLEARVLSLQATSGDPQAVPDDGRRYWVIGTPTGRHIGLLAEMQAHAMVESWRQQNPAAVQAWAAQQNAIADEVEANLKRIITGQDRADDLWNRSRPFDALTALGEGPKAGKVPPVIAHAPPARRGRWSRG